MATTLQPQAQIGRWIRLPPLPTNIRGLRTAGLVLGLGIGGFVDGIVFHMLLQWHHLICINCGSGAQSPFDLRKEILSDGLFHVVTLGLVVVGVFLLWQAVRRAPALFPPRFLVGAILLGWGAFNLAEGLLDHQILGIHHVRPGPHRLAWDLAFLASGPVLAALGWWEMRSARAAEARSLEPSL
jgi:uncharacterized membrane protein